MVVCENKSAYNRVVLHCLYVFVHVSERRPLWAIVENNYNEDDYNDNNEQCTVIGQLDVKVTVNPTDDNSERGDKRDRGPATGLVWDDTITETMAVGKTARLQIAEIIIKICWGFFEDEILKKKFRVM